MGHISIKHQRDTGMATLWLDIRSGDYIVGCDGVKRGINEYLSRHHPLASQNTQNTRYQCDDDKLKAVIHHYAIAQA